MLLVWKVSGECAFKFKFYVVAVNLLMSRHIGLLGSVKFRSPV
jgi:hypothetical protein